MATINGTPIVFTFGSAAGMAITELTGNLTQDIGHAKKSERFLVKDGTGSRVTSAHTDFHETTNIRYIVSGTTLAAAITNGTAPTIGSFINVTSCTQYPTVCHKYEVIDSSAKLTNTGALEITLDVEYAAGIQAAAS